jgi:hypothetical protein
MALDVSYVGQHSFATVVSTNINAVDFGAAFLPQNQDPTLAASATPGGTAIATDLMRSYVGYGAITANLQTGWRTYQSMQFSLNRRFKNDVSFGFSDTWSFYDHQSTAPRFQHMPDGSFQLRSDQAQADQLLGTAIDTVQVMRANFVWGLPKLVSTDPTLKKIGYVVNDWQLSGVWSGRTGQAYSIAYSYQSGGGNVNLTGSPDYGARVNIVGSPGSGCSADPLRQFNTAAFIGPAPGSVGLDSGAGYLRGCFSSTLDLSIARSIRIGGSRSIQLRADVFNAPNLAGITARNTTMNLNSPSDPRTITNLPFDANGNVIAARAVPNGAGFGVATAYQNPRSVQLQIRFMF